jgi:hypothetical protein
MAHEDYASNLLKVSELRRAIKNKFTAKMLQDQGLERDLTQIYKPLTESQTKNTRDIASHLSKLSNETNKKITDALLDVVPADVEDLIDIMSEEKAVYEHVSQLASADELKAYLSNDTNAKKLLRYVELNPKTSLKSNPWRRIRTQLPDFYNEIKSAKTQKKGTGLIKFLPSGKTDLIRELFRLMGSYKSGNKSVYNELNAVVDELRRKGILSIKQSKRIYKTIS